MDFLWHKVSEKEKQEIQKQAKSIMDDLSNKLSKIGKKIDESLIERDDGERDEGGNSIEIDRDIIFENAPEKNGDFIVAERKKW